MYLKTSNFSMTFISKLLKQTLFLTYFEQMIILVIQREMKRKNHTKPHVLVYIIVNNITYPFRGDLYNFYDFLLD